ncbi:MAG TPA: DUF5684 domain-containing protein [Acidimicrobiia bacterium]|nr:DUF5684 domain-containing protein [Acidimicrobiia bacterium]
MTAGDTSVEYEFDADQNRVVASVARNARFAGAMNLLLTAALVFASVKLAGEAGWSLSEIGSALIVVAMAMALTVVYGIWLLRAASRFTKIVSTQGTDMAHLMLAFRELANIYQTQWWLYVISFVVGIGLLLLAWVPLQVTVFVAIVVFEYAGIGKVFAKAGYSGWSIVVPYYNLVVLVQVAGKPFWWSFLLIIPGVNVVVGALVSFAIARSFGRGTGFGVGLWLLPWVFYPILGFGNAEYYAGANLR